METAPDWLGSEVAKRNWIEMGKIFEKHGGPERVGFLIDFGYLQAIGSCPEDCRHCIAL